MDFVETFLKYMEPFKGSKRWHLWSALAATSAALERRVWLSKGIVGRIYPNTYIILHGKAGMGKSTIAEMLFKLFTEVNDQLGDKGISIGPKQITPAALIEYFQRARKEISLDGNEKEVQSSVFIYVSELKNLLKDLGGGNLASDLLEYYDAGESPLTKQTLKGGYIKIPKPSLTLLGCCTPDFLHRYLPGELSGDGLASRMIFVPETSFVDMDSKPQEGDKQLWNKLRVLLLAIAETTGEFVRTTEADRAYDNFFHPWRKRLFDLRGNSNLVNYYSRKGTHVDKLSLILAASEGGQRYIESSHVERAVDLLDLLEPDMQDAFGAVSIDNNDRAAAIVLSHIPFAPDSCTEHDLSNRMWQDGIYHRLGVNFDGLIGSLLSSGQVTQLPGNTMRIYQRNKLGKI